MKDKKIKVIANYLPQYHEIPENNIWWGKGFTDWVSVKKAKPLYKEHNQPRIPLNKRYYHLDDVDSIRWQVELANRYGIYGFGIYHYWFSSKQMLLQKPAEIIRDNKDIDINYMFIWDNNSWTRTWSKKLHSNDWAPKYDIQDKNQNFISDGMLAELIYGNEIDWKKHFDYLLTFFVDERYIKIDNKPVFCFFNPHNEFEILRDMFEYWNGLAIKAGFSGIICMTKAHWRNLNFEYGLRYSPLSPVTRINAIKNRLKDAYAKKFNKIRFYNYDTEWKKY